MHFFKKHYLKYQSKKVWATQGGHQRIIVLELIPMAKVQQK